MIEAEYKARLSTPDAVRDHLCDRAQSESVTYHDTYFDDETDTLSKADRELRLRTITSPDSTQHLLTFKDAAVDSATGSKPEYETIIADRNALTEIIDHLGYTPAISFSKKCENFRFSDRGRDLLATLVTVPELEGTYLELETQVSDKAEMDAALGDLRSILHEIGVSDGELTTELYTDAVAKKRDSQ